LIRLPDSIGNLPLRGLSVAENKLTKLPETIGKLTGLTLLLISGNDFIDPIDISKFTKLSNNNKSDIEKENEVISVKRHGELSQVLPELKQKVIPYTPSNVNSNNSAKNPGYSQLTEDNIGDIMEFYGYKHSKNPKPRTHEEFIAQSVINIDLEAEREAERKAKAKALTESESSSSSDAKGGKRSRKKSRKTDRTNRTTRRNTRTTTNKK
jgi:hypothetical protein